MRYEDVVEMIEDSERWVDEVLKAARLDRNERVPTSWEMMAMILNYAVGTLAMVIGFAALYLIIYFIGTEGR